MMKHLKIPILLLWILLSIDAFGVDDFLATQWVNQDAQGTAVRVRSTEVNHNGKLVQALMMLPALGADAGVQYPVFSSVRENSHIIKQSSGVLIELAGTSLNTSGQWIMIFDATAVPQTGAVPVFSFGVKPYASADPSSANISHTVPITGWPFQNGIVVCNSTTPDSLTLGAADCKWTGWFK